MASAAFPYRTSYVLATGLLLLMALLLCLSQTVLAEYAIAGWLKAFSEAALVGALADWFAVTAMFRRPLGLPIPHTAIIPHRKERIGEALGVFVRENFINEQVIGKWLRENSPSAEFTRYLSVPPQRALVVRRLAHLAQDLLSSLDDEATRHALSRILAELCARRMDLAPAAGKFLSLVLAADKDDLLFQEGLGHAERLLALHAQGIEQAIGHELPWYMPRFMQDRLYRSLVNSVHEFIQAVKSDTHHPARAQFKTYASTAAAQLEHDECVRAQGRAFSAQILSSPGLQQLLEELWAALNRSLAAPTDGVQPLERILEAFFSTVVDTLLKDPLLAKRIDRLLEKLTRRLVQDYGAGVVRIISETIRAWNSDTLVQKLEDQVGKDLQYIRINGTLVGGLVGLVLYCI